MISDIVAVFTMLQDYISAFAGFGVNDSDALASFLLVVWLALFGAVCLNQLAQRRDSLHLAINAIAMFAGGVIGNAMLRGVHLPLGNELVVTATLALFGMSAAALILLLAYRRTDF